MANTVEEILERLTEAREGARITQRQAARHLGISQAYVAGLEVKNNTPAVWPLLARMCELYQVDSNWILGLPNAREGDDLAGLFGKLSPGRQRDVMAIVHLWLLEESQEYRDQLLGDLIDTDWDNRVMSFLTGLRQNSGMFDVGGESDSAGTTEGTKLLTNRQ